MSGASFGVYQGILLMWKIDLKCKHVYWLYLHHLTIGVPCSNTVRYFVLLEFSNTRCLPYTVTIAFLPVVLVHIYICVCVLCRVQILQYIV